VDDLVDVVLFEVDEVVTKIVVVVDVDER